jgi:hypothetical protein
MLVSSIIGCPESLCPSHPPLRLPESRHRSQLFTVRVWLEDLGDGRSEWRGKVQHVLSGEVRYFRDWATLIAALQEMFKPCEGSQALPMGELKGG